MRIQPPEPEFWFSLAFLDRKYNAYRSFSSFHKLFPNSPSSHSRESLIGSTQSLDTERPAVSIPVLHLQEISVWTSISDHSLELKTRQRLRGDLNTLSSNYGKP